MLQRLTRLQRDSFTLPRRRWQHNRYSAVVQRTTAGPCLSAYNPAVTAPVDAGDAAQPAQDPGLLTDGKGEDVKPESFNITTEDASDVQPNALTTSELWWAAIKPPMYSVGFIPVLVGAAAAFWDYGAVSFARAAAFVLASIMVIAWLNLSNDAFDSETGVDKTKPESVVNLTGNRNGVLLMAIVLLTGGAGLLAYLISLTQDWRIGAMLAFSIGCGYIYQGPPFRLSYKGLGEPLCFFAFGPSATTAFYLALLPRSTEGMLGATPAATPLVATLAVLVGITTTVILFCSHWHQIRGDLANGKMSPLVKLGSREKALPILRASVASVYVLSLGAGLAGVLPWQALLATTLSMPAAHSLLQYAQDNYHSESGITPLKRYATKWHILYGICLVLGLILGGGTGQIS